MKQNEWREWDNESDMVAWTSHGLSCLILRNPLKTLCGYVRVERDHPHHGKHYNTLNKAGVEVHGGLTFSGPIHGDERWAFGFDCAHLGDYVPEFMDVPGFSAILKEGCVYRNIAYVRHHVEILAKALAEAYDPTEVS